MIKKIKQVGAMLVLVAVMSSCAMVSSPVMGTLYTDVKSPFAVTSNSGASKVGSAEATCILGILATGDASITAATKKAGITKIHHIDQHATSILGLFSKYEIFVYGE